MSCLGLNNFDHSFLKTNLKTLTFNCKSTGERMSALKSFYGISRKGNKVQGGRCWEGGGGIDLQNTLLSVKGYIVSTRLQKGETNSTGWKKMNECEAKCGTLPASENLNDLEIFQIYYDRHEYIAQGAMIRLRAN